MQLIEIIILVFSIISTLLLLVVAIFLLKRKSSVAPDGLSQQLNDVRREIQDTTNRQRQEIQQRLDVMHDQISKNWNESSKAFQFTLRDVTERLTKLDETNKQVLNFSGQLQSLENILKNPKHRGILGEYWLETLLGQVLQPAQYQMQFELGVDENTKSKLIADAVIFVRDLVIPIDAKFSLENYNRISQESDVAKREVLNREFKSDVKKRIDETSKYIHPERGTTNFAFMFVPAEGVYYNLLTSNVGAAEVSSKDLVEYAFSKGVMIVSPTSFFAYLQTVIMGLKALQVEESVKEIQKQAEHLMRHLKTYEDYHNKVGKHLETTINVYSAASNELKKIDKDIYRITDGSAGKELEMLELSKSAGN